MVIFLILMTKLSLLITVVTNTFKSVIMDTFGLPRWLSGKEPTCQSMQEMWVHSLGQEDPLEKEMQPTPVFLPGKSYEQRSLADYGPQSCKTVGHNLATK